MTCTRCHARVLITVADRCADCVADIGLNHPAEHGEWHAEVKRRYTGS